MKGTFKFLHLDEFIECLASLHFVFTQVGYFDKNTSMKKSPSKLRK